MIPLIVVLSVISYIIQLMLTICDLLQSIEDRIYIKTKKRLLFILTPIGFTVYYTFIGIKRIIKHIRELP